MYAKLKTAGRRRVRHRDPRLRLAAGDVEPRACCRRSTTRASSYNLIAKQYLGFKEDPHNEYSVPKDYASTGIVYDPVAIGGKIVTWTDYFDAMKKKGVSGKVEMPAEPAEVFGIALWAMGGGKDWNTATEADLKQAYEYCLSVVKDVKAFNDFDTAGVVNGSVLAACQTNANARLCMLQNKKLEFVIPQPKSELILDNYTIPTHAPDVEPGVLVHQLHARAGAPGRRLHLPRLPAAAARDQVEAAEEHEARGHHLHRPRRTSRGCTRSTSGPSVQGYAEQLYSQLQAAA